MDKKYKYIKLVDIENYEGWDLVQIIPAKFQDYYDMCVICNDDAPQEDRTLYEDIIKRQKAEIENLSIALEATRDNLGDTREELNKAETEIEMLKDNSEHLTVMLAEAKSEVAKEIFDEIGALIRRHLNDAGYIFGDFVYDANELKKKGFVSLRE